MSIPNRVIFDTPAAEGNEVPAECVFSELGHRWQVVGGKPEGWLWWIAQSCECGATRQVRTPR